METVLLRNMTASVVLANVAVGITTFVSREQKKKLYDVVVEPQSLHREGIGIDGLVKKM